ncbi:MAG: helix-turn-helix domain-containing protein [Hyphomicrobiaceae bacterium]
MSLDQFIGSKLQELRAARAVDPEKIASLLSIPLELYAAFELGRVSISARHLYDLCHYLDVPVTFFFDGYEDAPQQAAGLEDRRESNGSSSSET